jgi:hypothetical protein
MELFLGNLHLHKIESNEILERNSHMKIVLGHAKYIRTMGSN